MDIHEKARAMASAFERRTRDNGATFDALKDGSPAWMDDAILSAHQRGEMLPNDWTYETIRNLLDRIAESDDLDDDKWEAVESCVDIYNGGLAAWLGSHAYRVAFCDEAVSQGLETGPGILEAIQAGQRLEAGEIWDALIGALDAADAD
jgi:hypothetical protein